MRSVNTLMTVLTQELGGVNVQCKPGIVGNPNHMMHVSAIVIAPIPFTLPTASIDHRSTEIEPLRSFSEFLSKL